MKKIKSVILIIIQLALIALGCYYMYMFVAPIFGIIFNIGSVLGAFLSLIAILTGMFLKPIIRFCKKHYKSRKGKIVLNTLFSVLGIGTVCLSDPGQYCDLRKDRCPKSEHGNRSGLRRSGRKTKLYTENQNQCCLRLS